MKNKKGVPCLFLAIEKIRSHFLQIELHDKILKANNNKDLIRQGIEERCQERK